MTTNHIENIDPALIRPGRIDYRIDFKLCEKEQIKEMYLFTLEKDIPEDIYNKIPNKPKHTSSHIYGLLFRYRNDLDMLHKELTK